MKKSLKIVGNTGNENDINSDDNNGIIIKKVHATMTAYGNTWYKTYRDIFALIHKWIVLNMINGNQV